MTSALVRYNLREYAKLSLKTQLKQHIIDGERHHIVRCSPELAIPILDQVVNHHIDKFKDLDIYADASVNSTLEKGIHTVRKLAARDPKVLAASKAFRHSLYHQADLSLTDADVQLDHNYHYISAKDRRNPNVTSTSTKIISDASSTTN